MYGLCPAEAGRGGGRAGVGFCYSHGLAGWRPILSLGYIAGHDRVRRTLHVVYFTVGVTALAVAVAVAVAVAAAATRTVPLPKDTCDTCSLLFSAGGFLEYLPTAFSHISNF